MIRWGVKGIRSKWSREEVGFVVFNDFKDLKDFKDAKGSKNKGIRSDRGWFANITVNVSLSAYVILSSKHW